MIEDDVLREVRAAREAYARLHNFDVRAMAKDLRARDLAGDWQVVSMPPRRPHSVPAPSVGPIETSQRHEVQDDFDRAIAQSSDKLAALAREALAEHRSGQTEPLDPERL